MASLYDPADVRPMWEELIHVGIQPLTEAEEVDKMLSEQDVTVLCIVNSVCGCAAGSARPGVCLALQNDTIPDRFVTVFAGVDQDAVARAREFMPGVAPSSPAIALLRDGKPLHIVERRHIEQLSAIELANHLAKVFDRHCTRQGPSVPREVFEQTPHVDICGSSL